MSTSPFTWAGNFTTIDVRKAGPDSVVVLRAAGSPGGELVLRVPIGETTPAVGEQITLQLAAGSLHATANQASSGASPTAATVAAEAAQLANDAALLAQGAPATPASPSNGTV